MVARTPRPNGRPGVRGERDGELAAAVDVGTRGARHRAAACAAIALTTGLAGAVAPGAIRPANAAEITVGAPTKVDLPGWSQDAVTFPATPGLTWSAASSNGKTTYVRGARPGETRTLFTADPAAKSVAVVFTGTPTRSGDTVKGKPASITYTTSSVPVTVPAAAEPTLTAEPVTGYRRVTLTKVDGIAWTVTPVGGASSASVTVRPDDFTGTTTTVTVPRGGTGALVVARPMSRDYLLGGTAPVGTAWRFSFAAVTRPVLSVPAHLAPVFVDLPGRSGDAITLSDAPGVQWRVNGTVVEVGKKSPRTILLDSGELTRGRVGADGRETYVIAAAPSGTAFAPPPTTPMWTGSFAREPISLDMTGADQYVTAVDGPLGNDSVAINSPSAALTWLVNGAPAKVTPGQTTLVPTKGATSVAVIAMPAGSDTTLVVKGRTTSQWVKVLQFTQATTPIAIGPDARPTRSGADLVLTAVERVTWVVNGQAVTIPAGVAAKSFAVPFGPAEVVAKPELGYSVAGSGGASIAGGAWRWIS